MSNEEVFRAMVEQNNALNQIYFINNSLSFQGKTLQLTSLSLVEVYNDFSQLKADISFMEPKEVFEVIEINIAFKNYFILQELEHSKPTLVTLHEYKTLASKDTSLSFKEQTQLTDFADFMFQLRTYEQYLIPEGKNLLAEYTYFIELLATKENPTPLEEAQVKKYTTATEKLETMEMTNENRRVSQLKLEQQLDTREKMAGFASSILIVEITSFVAITLAALLFVFLQK